MTRQNTERNLQILAEHQRGMCNKSIASLFGISEERARQIVAHMKHKHDIPLSPEELALHVELVRLNNRQTRLVNMMVEVNARQVVLREHLLNKMRERNSHKPD